MTVEEGIKKALRNGGTSTAAALAKSLGVSKAIVFRTLKRIAAKKGRVRQGSVGPLAALWVLK
jgi:Mn-dependent DtxR family transcriptional regulator